MSIYHDEVEIEDFEYDEEEETYYYPCPCGDQFQITKVKINSSNITFKRMQIIALLFWFRLVSSDFQEELMAGEEVATCPSCSLVIKVIYDLVNRLFFYRYRFTLKECKINMFFESK